MLASQARVQARCNLVPSRWSVALPCTGCLAHLPCAGCLAHGKVCKFCTQRQFTHSAKCANFDNWENQNCKKPKTKTNKYQHPPSRWSVALPCTGQNVQILHKHQCTHSEYCENVDNCAKCKNMNTKRIKHPPPLTWSVAYWLAHSTTLCKLSPAWNEPHEIENSYIS